MPAWERVGRPGGRDSLPGWPWRLSADGTMTRVFAATPVGVFRSADGGQTWSPLGEASAVAGVEVVTPSPRFAEDGALYVGAARRAVPLAGREDGWDHLVSDEPGAERGRA